MQKKLFSIAGVIILGLLLVVVVYNLPPVRSRLEPRVDELQIRIRSIIDPPEKAAFVPQGQVVASLQPTALPSATPTPKPTYTYTPTRPASTPLPSATPTLTPTPLPGSFALTGVKYQDQHGLWNYCAPTNLAMALSFWDVNLDRLEVGKAVKPNELDKNVMPYEMVDYVNNQTSLRGLARVAGDMDLIKKFIANGFPVLVEKGAWIKDFSGVVSWMGHYEVITGYDDARNIFIAQDSYYTPDYEVPYDTFERGWRSFNYAYIMIYPPEKEQQVFELLGQQADETANLQYAAQKASDEIFQQTDVDQFFAWYNRGTNLKDLQDFTGAAIAYDEAFAIYNSLPEDKSIRPYRILWYETGPYFAYFYTGRYYDVISLADTAIGAVLDDNPALEESFYWRGMAKAALGDTTGAIADYRESLKWHPGFEPSVYQLTLLGVENS